jgi:hypothetical protein
MASATPKTAAPAPAADAAPAPADAPAPAPKKALPPGTPTGRFVVNGQVVDSEGRPAEPLD